MRTFTISDRHTTADIGLDVTGDSLPELFQAAAEGMFAIILGPSGPSPKADTREVNLRATTPEQLLVDWLSDLIFLFDAEALVPVAYRLTMTEEKEPALRAAVDFRRYAAGRETAEHEIKAVTYYQLRVERNGGGYRCHLVFDI